MQHNGGASRVRRLHHFRMRSTVASRRRVIVVVVIISVVGGGGIPLLYLFLIIKFFFITGIKKNKIVDRSMSRILLFFENAMSICNY